VVHSLYNCSLHQALCLVPLHAAVHLKGENSRRPQSRESTSQIPTLQGHSPSSTPNPAWPHPSHQKVRGEDARLGNREVQDGLPETEAFFLS
jgi:hypothetical protein